MRSTKGLVRLAALLAVVGALVLIAGSLAPLTPDDASADDKKIELQFFELNHAAGKDWTDATVKAILGDAATAGTVNGIWAQASPDISFAWPKNITPGEDLTPLADTNLLPGAPSVKGDVKIPICATSAYGYLPESLPGCAGLGQDPKGPPEVTALCDAARTAGNPKQLPVILIQDFVDAITGAPVPLLGLTRINPPAGAKGNPGTPGGPGNCIILDKDSQPPPEAVGEVLAHELGHAMCLPHDNTAGNLMQAVGTGTILKAGAQTKQAPGGFLCPKRMQDKLRKPLNDGNLSGVYDALVHNNNKAQGLFHCILRIDHDLTTNEVKVSAQCYLDTPGQAPGSPLLDTADTLPGPVPPPPYGTAKPTKLNGSFDSGADTIALRGCFDDVGGNLGPNVIADVTIPNAKATLASGILSGTVLIYDNASNAQCNAKTPSGTPPPALNVNLYKAGGASPAPWRPNQTDFDLDGCTDADELDKPHPKLCGDDPYNPHDSDASLDGPFNLTVTAVPADWNKTTNTLIPGSYFHCIGNTDQTGLNVDINVQCYTDSPTLAGLSGSPLKTDQNGLAGAPPPPPFTDTAPTKATGVINGNTLTTAACFRNVGGALGPNIITTTIQDIRTGLGTVDIYASQENDNCDASPPTPKGAPNINDAPLASTEQDANWDSDDDTCSDAQELAKPPVKGCGDDPYNPLDSDSDLNAAFDIAVTVVRADVCKAGLPAGPQPVGCSLPVPAPDGQIATGSYFQCKADIQHTNQGTTNNLAARVLCYTDNDLTTVNCQDAANSAANPCATAITCQPIVPAGAHASRCGNGLPDVPPPSNDPDAGGPGGTAYADIDATHTVLSGQLDKPNNEIELEGCFAGVENPTQGPNIYARTVIDSDTGQGTVDIWLNRANCNKPDTANAPETVCTGAVDDDKDGFINDGCPASGPPEVGANCADALDKEPDGLVNDGCPAAGKAPTYNDAAIRIAEQAANRFAKPETNCKDALDNEKAPGTPDGFVNDGCPRNGNAGEFFFFMCGDGVTPNIADQNDFDTNPPTGVFYREDDNGNVKHDESMKPPAGDDDVAPQGINDGCPVRGPLVNPMPISGQRDSDGDSCADAQELRDTVATGGRRDPYNRWDLMAVWHGSPLIKDKIVGSADLSAVVARFGATDTGAGTFDRNSNPTLTPNLPILPSGSRANYHPSFDREGSLVGSNAWNLKPPNGNVGAPELANTVAQFGNQCNT